VADNVLRFDFLAKDDFSKTADKVGRETDGLGAKIGKFSKFAVTALAGVATAGAGLVAAGAMVGVKTAASLEQAQIGFATLLHSGQKAQVFLKQLTSFAAATPFNLAGLVDSSRTLIGVGVNAKDTMKILQNFGDASSAVGLDQASFQRIMIATSQAIGAGKFQTADFNQIMNNGLPIWHILSEATGKSTTQLRKMASTGKLLASQVLPELQTQMHKDYGGAMARQSETLNGLWSTFTDTLSLGLAKAITPMIPALKTGLAGASTVAGDALKLLPGILKGATDAFKTARSYVTGTFVPDVENVFSKISKKLPKIDISGMGANIQKQAQDWGGLILSGVKVGLRTGDWKELGSILGGGLSVALGNIGTGSLNIGKKITDWVKSVDWEPIGKQAALIALPFAVGFISNFGGNLLTVIKQHPFDFALTVISFLGVGKAGDAIAEVLEHLPILKWFAPLFRGLHGLTGPVNDALGGIFDHVGTVFKDGFLRAVPEAEGGIGRVITGIGDTIRLRIMYAKDAGMRFVDGIIGGMGEMLGKVVRMGATIVGRLLGPYVEAGRWLVNRGVDMIGGLIDGAMSLDKKLINTSVKLGKDAVEPFASSIKWLYDAGRQMLAGLRNGMVDMASNAGAWAKSVGDKIVGAVKGYFGIHSPSKVFGAIGSNLIQSLFGKMIDHNPVQAVTKIFGGMPQALGALVDKSLISLDNLPSKAMDTLGHLGGKFTNLLGFGSGSGGLSGPEKYIISHESGGSTTAQNPTSTAFGLGQLILANRVMYGKMLGVDPNTTNYGAQLKMFRMYVHDRYGTAEKAAEFWRAHHFYDAGGVANGMGWMAKATLRPERVLSAGQTESFDRLTRVLDRRGPEAAGGSSVDIDYRKLGDHVAAAFTRAGVTVSMDGAKVGTVIGKRANLLGRAG
jgi:tape measure domain-containing protein